MTKYSVDGKMVEGKSYYDAVAKATKRSVAEAIADRTHPADSDDCAEFFLEAVGRRPTDIEMHTMQPDSKEAVTEFWARYRCAMYLASCG